MTSKFGKEMLWIPGIVLLTVTYTDYPLEVLVAGSPK